MAPRLGRLLRERVEEAPFDDAPRLVYADYLLEKADPRGTFIQLSFEAARRELDAREAKLQASILKVHERSWLGPVLDVTEHRAYARGFLGSCSLAESAQARIDAAIGHRAWSTVSTLGLRSLPWGVDLILDGCTRGLVQVDGVGVADIVRLASHDTPLTIEEIQLTRTRGNLEDLVARLASAAPGLARWRRLELRSVFDPDDVALLDGTPLGEQLERLRLRQWPKTLRIWIERLQALSLRATIDLGFGTVFRGADGRFSGLQVELERATAFADSHNAEVLGALNALRPDVLTELRIYGVQPAQLEAVRGLARRHRRLASPAIVEEGRAQRAESRACKGPALGA